MSYDKNKPSEYDGLFQKAADAHGVSYDLLRKLAFNESSFNPNAKSKTGPLGIMQFTKGTAKGLGLKVTGGADDARLNPELAIDAGARHLSDLIRKYDGDELKAALAYNQGEGPNGAPQIQAYEKGDWASISEEGRNYMRKLLDVANSPRKGDLENFGGITPKAQGIPSDVAFKGISKQGKVGTELPESTGFTVKGKEQEAPAKPFAKDFWETHGTTLDEYEQRSTFFGFGDAASAELHNSTLGVAFRAARSDNGFDVFKDVLTPTKWNSYVPTKEDLDKLRNSGLPPSYYNVVTGGDAETWDELINIAKKNYEMDQKASEAGLGAKLAAGVIGAGADPLSYVPMVGVAGKGLKIANKAFTVGVQSAGLNVLSEGLRTSVAGGEAHYADAALSGLVFGAGMSAISDAAAATFRKSGKAEPVNDFIGPTTRLEARETAINTGGEDMTRMPSEDRVFDKEYNGVPFADHPTEDGAIILGNGAILSDTNPVNPKTLQEFAEIDPERAAPGVKLGGFTELGLKMLRSESTEIRGIAQDLVRSPTGMESGSHGKFGATASDIKERLHYTDQRTYNQLYDAMRTAMKDPEFSVGDYRMSREQVKQEIYKRVAMAIERPELQANLTKSERQVMDIIKGHFDAKREMMEMPSMFGNGKAVSIFPGSRHKGTYVPQVYDQSAKALMLQRYGAEGLQEAIARSWLQSYNMRPEVKTRVDEYLMELNGVQEVTPEMVQKHAMDKAYGISHTDQFNSSSVIDENLEGLVGIENNSFLEARNMFDSDLPITLPDGNTFSVNDLRNFDMSTVMPAYDRRINGDIAIMGGSGKTTAELKDEIVALQKKAKGNGKLMSEVKALQDTVKILTGRARRNQDTPFETAMRSLNDLAFFAKNAYMGAQNLTEVAGLISKGNAKAMVNNIPFINKLALRDSPVSVKELKELHGVLFGKELDDLIRPKREDIIQRMRESSDVSNAMSSAIGTLKYTTQELAARSPWTKMLNSTANGILNTARQGVLLDVAEHVLSGKKSTFGKDNLLKSASITPEQWNGIKQLFRDYAVRGEDGKFTIKDKKAFSQDPRAMDLWRMADKYADEVMLRPHKVSSQDSTAYNALTRMAMQFKNFTIKSLNGRFLRMFYEGYKNNRAIDQALTAVISAGLAGGFYLASAHTKAYGLPEQQRKDYLKRATSEKMIAFASITRSSHLGAPLGVASLLGGLAGWDPAKMVRTSVLPKGETGKQERDRPMTGRELAASIMGNIGEQIPSVGFLGSGAAVITNAAGVLNAPNRATEIDFMTGLMNATREMVPNDPLTQQLIMKIYEEQGVHIKETPRPN